MTDREWMAWDIYFASVVGMNLHPGNLRENAHKLTTVECAGVANEMLEVRRLIERGEFENGKV